MNIRRENAKQISISECIKRTERFFEEKTAKQKMLTFETELGRKKNSEIRWKICYNMLCALPVWESFVPFLQKIDMAEVLLYPLPPDPLLLSHSDGSMLSSSKSNLINLLSASSREFTKHV